MSSYKIVGGLDPSLSNFGMAKGHLKIDSEGIHFKPTHIKLTVPKSDKTIKYKNMDDLQRARELGKAMLEFFDGVDDIYVEIPVGSQSARAMASYGVCIGLIAALGKRVIRVSAKDVKLIATNNPEATKKDMINWAYDKYPYLPWLIKSQKGTQSLINANEHMADAIAAIHAGLELK